MKIQKKSPRKVKEILENFGQFLSFSDCVLKEFTSNHNRFSAGQQETEPSLLHCNHCGLYPPLPKEEGGCGQYCKFNYVTTEQKHVDTQSEAKQVEIATE